MLKKLLLICIILVLVVIAVGCVLEDNPSVPDSMSKLNNFFYEDSDEYIGTEIVFAQAGDATVFSDTALNYNLTDLKKQLPQDETYFVTYEPQITDYRIVSDFGFDMDGYSLWNDGRRYYVSQGEDKAKSLLIDQYGCFLYNTGIAETVFEMPLTDKECFEIAKSFLEENGLFSERLGTKWFTNETILYSESQGERKITTGINFLVDNALGNAGILVEVNGNGEVVSVVYKVREYKKSQRVGLISLEEAVTRFEKGKASIELENTSAKLDFEKVSVKYWSLETDPDNLMVQPVYVFEGKSTTSTGETEPFTIVVQANKVK